MLYLSSRSEVVVLRVLREVRISVYMLHIPMD